MAEGGFQRIPLGEALNLWLSEFGLATRVEAKDLGRLGMSLTVAPTGGSRLIDLTSVGVGVSQVLPVILLCLLSRSTSVILLEQPELHLHPAMQLKLADFLNKSSLKHIASTW
jgi:predicted ATPase